MGTGVVQGCMVFMSCIVVHSSAGVQGYTGNTERHGSRSSKKLQVYRSSTVEVQRYRGSSVLLWLRRIRQLIKVYTGTVVLQVYMATGIVHVYRCTTGYQE